MFSKTFASVCISTITLGFTISVKTIYSNNNYFLLEELTISGKKDNLSESDKLSCERLMTAGDKNKFLELQKFIRSHKVDSLYISVDDNIICDVDHNSNIKLNHKFILQSEVFRRCPNPNLEKEYGDINQTKAILGHELGHIKHEHLRKCYYMSCIISLLTGPAIMIKYGVGPFYVLMSYYVYLRRQYEYEADAYAAKLGYGDDLIRYFQVSIDANKYSNNIIAKYTGENILDLYHPFLRHRITHLQNLIQSRGTN